MHSSALLCIEMHCIGTVLCLVVLDQIDRIPYHSILSTVHRGSCIISVMVTNTITQTPCAFDRLLAFGLNRHRSFFALEPGAPWQRHSCTLGSAKACSPACAGSCCMQHNHALGGRAPLTCMSLHCVASHHTAFPFLVCEARCAASGWVAMLC
jgi:hypothetical protein